MSITPSIPVLQGRGGTVLSAEQEGLVLERPGEELTIPAVAIARVHAEARSVTVELRAPAGATPSIHRIEDVSEAAAVVFADAVNALLPERTEEVDGGALLVLRTFAKTRRQKFLRRLKWFVFGCLGGVVALCVTAGIAGVTGLAIAIVPIGAIATASLGVGVYCVWTWNRERRLLKHGITVVASRAGRPGAYLYTDSTGTTRVLSHWGVEPYVRASYDPQDPSDVLVPQAPFMRRLNITLGAFILFCGLNGAGLAIWMTVMTVLGEEL
ncbi:hypothetical protein ACH46N_11965 [Streptomyces pristinaespiralis]|jgi:hypothetical protein|uniref:Uncharacterized protein n=2 Tax=Streptomyces pristinaespiralis TaxID=38300 RepID=B5H7B7_STRE2|nr:hypothetical protein [Streptomyces pristinaespiralis]ALC24788.1 hypothetical protein SPRI_6482 [Streptomyces pristinaespiralis]EDY62728.1 conserved hypothetical protein [Streptomyces pristinaespiralis ATCC 25486]QMU12901.1 hypothetical protein H3L99_04340 [Streptomyces pristinaespiralis]